MGTVVLNTAYKSSLTGGTFADTLTANSGDSLAVATFGTGDAKILEAWAIDSASVAELEWIYTRPDSTHDQQHGVRFNIPAVALGGAGTNAAFNLLPGMTTIPLQKNDTATLGVSGTASDAFVASWTTLYDDLPGAQGAVFIDWATAQNLRKSTFGWACNAVASGTKGVYGAARALNADDDRFHGDTWYAILGATVQTQCTTIALLGPNWAGQRIGLPAGALDLNSPTWFVDQSEKWGIPLIPCFQSSNKQNTYAYVADAQASTSPKIDFLAYELTTPMSQVPGF